MPVPHFYKVFISPFQVLSSSNANQHTISEQYSLQSLISHLKFLFLSALWELREQHCVEMLEINPGNRVVVFEL